MTVTHPLLALYITLIHFLSTGRLSCCVSLAHEPHFFSLCISQQLSLCTNTKSFTANFGADRFASTNFFIISTPRRYIRFQPQNPSLTLKKLKICHQLNSEEVLMLTNGPRNGRSRLKGHASCGTKRKMVG